MSKRVVVIGAGPGGLAASLLLAGAGLQVTVLERQSQVGGRTSALTADGFRFDRGPTFFLYPQVLERIFAAVGHDLHDHIKLIRLNPQYRLLFGGGGQIDATPDLQRLSEQVAALSPHDAQALPRFLDDNRHKLRMFQSVLESPFSSWRDTVHPRLLAKLPLIKPWLSLDRELSRYFHDPRIRLAFSFQSKYLGMSPYRCPSLFSILSFLEYEHGVFHPEGGCSAVTEAMAKLARTLGVDVRLNEPVTRLDFQGRRVTAARTAHDRYPTDALVINADFAHTMRQLVPDALRRRWTDRKLDGKHFSCSTFMLYLGIEGRYDDLPHHTIYIDADYARNLDEIENRHVLSPTPSFYLQNACVTDPALAPPGMSTLYLLIPVSHLHPNVNWAEEAARYRELALDRLACLGLSDIRQRIRYEKLFTPLDWAAQGIHLGATFNLAHSFRQMLHLRPRNRFEDLEGVYLVGGGTHPGSGLPVIFESARISARLLLEDVGVTTPLDTPAPTLPLLARYARQRS